MSELKFKLIKSVVQLTSSFGITIHYEVKLENDTFPFKLKSGFESSDCIFGITVYSESITDKETYDDDRVGEISPFLVGNKKSNKPNQQNLIKVRFTVYDIVFNQLLQCHHNGQIPSRLIITINDDYLGDFDDEKGSSHYGWNDFDMGENLRLPIDQYIFNI